MRKIIIGFIVAAVFIFSTFAFSALMEKHDYIGYSIMGDQRFEVENYQQWKECVDKCRGLCSNSSRPAYCFDQCMRACTD